MPFTVCYHVFLPPLWSFKGLNRLARRLNTCLHLLGGSPSGVTTDDISRLFIYYVGRKKDQPLGTRILGLLCAI